MADDAIVNGADDAILETVPADEVNEVDIVRPDYQNMSREERLEALSSDYTEYPDVSNDAEAADDAPPEAVTAPPAAPAVQDIPGLTPAPEKPAEVKPEGEQALADVADAPEAGKFRVRAADGSFVATPDLKVEFTINDKVYTKDIAGLTRLAYDGVAGQRAQANLRALETQTIPQIQQQSAQMLAAKEAELQAQIDLNVAILEDPSGETWAKHHEQLAAARSPEAIAQRARQDAQEARQQLQEAQEAQYRQNVFATHVEPALNVVATECPDVSEDARAGRIAYLTGHLLVNGKVPPASYPALVAILNGPYAEWARTEQKAVNEAKEATRRQVAEATKAKEAELRAAQKKQNALVAPMKPMGGVPSASATRPLAPAKTKAEAMERIINREYQSF